MYKSTCARFQYDSLVVLLAILKADCWSCAGSRNSAKYVPYKLMAEYTRLLARTEKKRSCCHRTCLPSWTSWTVC